MSSKDQGDAGHAISEHEAEFLKFVERSIKRAEAISMFTEAFTSQEQFAERPESHEPAPGVPPGVQPSDSESDGL